MRLHHLLLASAIAFAASPAAAAPSAQADVTLGKIANQYICRFDPSVPRGNLRSEADKAAGGTGQVLYYYERVLRGFAVRLPAEAGNRSQVAEMKARNPRLAGCEQDQYVKAFALAGKPGGGGTQPPQKVDWGVQRVGGPSVAPAGRRAWIIDTGVDFTHPDLNVDTSASRSFIRDSSPNDQNGHGSHVAGTIAACNNAIGAVGVAACARVVAVRVLDRNGRGTNSDVIAGVDYVAGAASPGDVANMSLGGGVSDALDTAVLDASQQSGAFFTLAAGNDGESAMNHSPARAGGSSSSDKVYTVSAFGSGDTFAYFSNYGNPPIAYAEPGVSIYSTYKSGGYATLSGTSMAAPHLAGILMASSNGQVATDGVVKSDPDSSPDPIGHR